MICVNRHGYSSVPKRLFGLPQCILLWLTLISLISNEKVIAPLLVVDSLTSSGEPFEFPFSNGNMSLAKASTEKIPLNLFFLHLLSSFALSQTFFAVFFDVLISPPDSNFVIQLDILNILVESFSITDVFPERFVYF